MSVLLILIAAAWSVCGLLAYAGTFGHLQRKWPSIAADGYDTDRLLSMAISVTGPIALVGTFVMSGGYPYGLKWK